LFSSFNPQTQNKPTLSQVRQFPRLLISSFWYFTSSNQQTNQFPFYFFFSITLAHIYHALLTQASNLLKDTDTLLYFFLGLQCWTDKWRERIRRGICSGFLYLTGLNGNSFLFALPGSSLVISLMASARFVSKFYHCLSSWDFFYKVWTSCLFLVWLWWPILVLVFLSFFLV
jgi:hypothetical protein